MKIELAISCRSSGSLLTLIIRILLSWSGSVLMAVCTSFSSSLLTEASPLCFMEVRFRLYYLWNVWIRTQPDSRVAENEHVWCSFLDKKCFAVSDSAEVMDWERRYKVIKGIAEGLLYLHCDCQRRIIHRDITASNILLSENYEAQVSLSLSL